MSSNMKIKLAKYLWVNLYFCLCISVVWYIYIGWLLINVINFSTTSEDFILTIGMLIFGIMPVLCVWIPHWRGFVVLEIQTESIHSYLFGVRKCTVETSQEVYYTIFEANIEKLKGATGKYIAISNKPFVYKDSPIQQFWTFRKRRQFFDYYDMSKQIILPYTEEIRTNFPVEEWINCNAV